MILGVTADSRRVRPGWLFAALPGAKADGKSFVPAAVNAGAAAVLAGEPIPGLAAPLVQVGDPRRAYALAAAAFYGAQPKTCVAVTGTNGKTSVAAFCRQIFEHGGQASASMGTLGVRAGDVQVTPPGLTTPDAADVAAILADLAARGVTHLALEASSHGIDQRRLDGVTLAAAGFLNLTQDHLDYHGTMEAYRAAKLRLFDTLLPRGTAAVLNADSRRLSGFRRRRRRRRPDLDHRRGHGPGPDPGGAHAHPGGQRLRIKAWGRAYELALPLAGAFQAGNALVAAGLCIAAGERVEAVLEALDRLEGAPGRLQFIGSGPRGGEAYVDYAHTPDGLRAVLEALRPHARGRLIVVFGAGGDRDRAKRPMMGAVAADLADIAIVTDDNPRSEDPAAIREEIRRGNAGLRDMGDRRAAITAAADLLQAGDILVLAGKGHETGQTIAGVTHPFDDAEEIRRALGLETAA